MPLGAFKNKSFENRFFAFAPKKCPEGLLMHPLAQPSRAPTTTAERDRTLIKLLRDTSGCCCAYSWWALFFPPVDVVQKKNMLEETNR